MTFTKFSRISLAVITTWMLFGACKKTVVNQISSENKPLNQAEIGKQIALNFYKSLSDQLNAGQPINLNGVKSGKGLAVQAIGDCGNVIRHNLDSTAVSGDTTRKFLGKSIFTLVCTGDQNDLYGADAYTLADTLTINETGTTFANKYESTQNYLVKSIIGTPIFNTQGSVTVTNYVSGLNNGSVTQSYKLSTLYTIESLGGQRYNDGSAKYILGRVKFASTQNSQAAGSVNNTSYAGHIMYYSATSIAAFFEIADKPGRYTKYAINLTTGEVSAPVESGPF